MFESWYASRPTSESAALLDRISESGRSEAQAAARRLVAVGELFVVRLRDSGEQADWPMDTWEAVAAQAAAALQCSISMASSYLRYAMALRDRLPEVGKMFQAGDIDYRAFQTIVFRTDLITDADALARVDALLAVRLSRYPSLTRGRLAAEVDRVVARVDRDAVRRAKEVIRDRFLDVDIAETGIAFVTGTVLATAGRALDRRLDELAGTVCDADPRTREQRRADALSALTGGADRLVCGCGSADCDAATRAGKSNVVIYVVAEQASADGSGETPGAVLGVEGLIPADMVAELAKTAKLQPLIPPVDAPEPRSVPSTALADFVRCRDLTCRAPGCDRPAVDCDLNHTVAYHNGGKTHASNLKALCRKHHLLKTFGGWRDKQLPDGTVIWLLPDGHTYVTTPGSALLFPSLCVPTGDLPVPEADPSIEYCGDRTAMMPRRRRTRAQVRAHRIAAERRQNHIARTAGRSDSMSHLGPAPPETDDDPPPF
ncbi:MAG TPA: HNH endonuclease signature motif containing protein [Mycobacterium sp.]|uniref:HNH endonuclease signature motif containing protein n=1 Tax=Mycobacterium sp. TaxID=1785 RepID=UPI002F3F92B9